MSPDLAATFVDTGLTLADWLPTEEGRVGMHPDLAFIYMTALAEEMAESYRYHPVTDETRDHLAVSGCTLERLARVLLDNQRLSDGGPTEQEVESCMATIAFEFVLPQGIANIPVQKIIEFRRRHADERAALQSHLQGMVNGLQEIEDRDALEVHLRVTYERELKPELNNYRRALNSLAIDTVYGAANVRTMVPPVLAGALEVAGPVGGLFAGLASSLNPVVPVVFATGAMVCSVLPVLRAKQKEARELTSPAAYLMHVEEGLGPATLTEWLARKARRFFLRV
jgi:hypothetical protein